MAAPKTPSRGAVGPDTTDLEDPDDGLVTASRDNFTTTTLIDNNDLGLRDDGLMMNIHGIPMSGDDNDDNNSNTTNNEPNSLRHCVAGRGGRHRNMSDVSDIFHIADPALRLYPRTPNIHSNTAPYSMWSPPMPPPSYILSCQPAVVNYDPATSSGGACTDMGDPGETTTSYPLTDDSEPGGDDCGGRWTVFTPPPPYNSLYTDPPPPYHPPHPVTCSSSTTQTVSSDTHVESHRDTDRENRS
jgi:hypothetical protein